MNKHIICFLLLLIIALMVYYYIYNCRENWSNPNDDSFIMLEKIWYKLMKISKELKYINPYEKEKIQYLSNSINSCNII